MDGFKIQGVYLEGSLAPDTKVAQGGWPFLTAMGGEAMVLGGLMPAVGGCWCGCGVWAWWRHNQELGYQSRCKQMECLIKK